jgi:phosphoribosylanthranilate isomerase
VFVKICGITSESDGLMAAAMGADAVGFVFAPSPRQIAPTLARDIARLLPPEVLTVGVFRDETPQRVVELVNQAGLRGVQLHGRESSAEVAWVHKRVPFVVKAVAAGDRQLDRADELDVDALLVDSERPGSGEVFDWSLAEQLGVGQRVVLAGGLTPDNVAEAIARVRPWGVDVSTGVERSPGRKDVGLVRRFINAATSFDEAGETLDPAELREIDPDDLPEDPEVYDWDTDPRGEA